MKEVEILRSLWPHLRRWPKWIALMVFLGFVQTLSESLGIAMLIPFFYAVTQGGLGGHFRDEAPDFVVQLVEMFPVLGSTTYLALAILGLLIIKNIFSYASGVAYGLLDARMSHGLRLRAIERLMMVDLDHLESFETGQLHQLIDSHTYEVMEAVHEVTGVLTTLVYLVAFSIILLAISPWMTLGVTVCFAVISLFVRWISRDADAIAEQGTDADERLSQQTLEMLRGMPVVRAFGCEAQERARYEAASAEVAESNVRFDRRSEAIGPVTEVLVAAVLVGVLFTAIDNPAPLPPILAFVLILYRAYPHIRALGDARLSIIGFGPAIARVDALLGSEVPLTSDSGSTMFGPLKKGIRFDDVRYRYKNDEPYILDGVSFEISAGRITALVGASGSGKSTLVRLLIRYVSPAFGEIFADACPLENLDLGSYRSGIALVSQEAHVFNRSIRENIGYGRPGATEQEIREAARQAHALEFVDALSDGMETVVGDMGTRLSGGQRQRIALARAILRKPYLLVLDEATNALDASAETVIQDSLDALGDQCTILIIAHRLSSIRTADRIVVLHRGKVIKEGDAAPMLNDQNLLALLWKPQAGAAQESLS